MRHYEDSPEVLIKQLRHEIEMISEFGDDGFFGEVPGCTDCVRQLFEVINKLEHAKTSGDPKAIQNCVSLAHRALRMADDWKTDSIQDAVALVDKKDNMSQVFNQFFNPENAGKEIKLPAGYTALSVTLSEDEANQIFDWVDGLFEGPVPAVHIEHAANQEKLNQSRLSKQSINELWQTAQDKLGLRNIPASQWTQQQVRKLGTCMRELATNPKVKE
jgi:hypothetical protein